METTVVSTKKQFAKYVSLSLLSMIGLSLYIFADTFFVANGVGSNGLAALNLSIPVYSFINGFGLLVGVGAATSYSIFKGSNQPKEANTTFTHAVKIAILFGGCFTLIGMLGSAPIARLLGSDHTLLPLVVDYMRTILFFSIPFVLNNVLVAFVRNDGNPKLSMIAMLSGSFANIILDYIFIFPLGLGMFGAAFATGLAPVISILILSLHFIKKKNQFHFIKCDFSRHIFSKIFSTGLPSFINEFSSGIVMLLFNFTILRLAGNIGVAAYGVIANIALIAVAAFTGIAQGVQPLISHAHGMNQEKTIKSLLSMATLCAFSMGAILYLVISCFPHAIVQIFNSENNMQLQDIAIKGTYLYFTAFFFMGINIVASSFFSCIEKPLPSFLISISRGIAMIIPIVFILPHFFGMTGVWLVIPFTELATFFITLFLLLKHKKNLKGTYLHK